MKPRFFGLLSLMLLLTASVIVPSQQSSFTVASIRPFDKAVPGQVMELMIEGIGSGAAPTVVPATDFRIEVLQDGVKQKAKVRIVKFMMMREVNPAKASSNTNTVDIGGMQLRVYQAVSFVVPQGLHPGSAEVVASYKGKRGNPIPMEIVEKPLQPVVGATSVLAASSSMPPERLLQKIEGNDFGWRFERGATATISLNPLVDPDDPNSAILIRFKQGGQDYDAVTRVTSNAARTESRGSGVGFYAAREDLEVDVPAALTLGKAEVEIRVKANGQFSDPFTVGATIVDMTRVAEAPNVSAPRLLLVTPNKVGAGQSLHISVDHLRTLEPSPKETQVIIEQENARYFATIEQNTALFGLIKDPNAPVSLFARTTRQFMGRVQVRVLNPLRGEQTGMSAPVSVEIVDEVLPPELSGVSESTDADLERMKEMYEAQKQAGKDFGAYDPGSRYLTIRARGVDYNPKFVRITLEQGEQKFTLSPGDLSFYSIDSLIVRLPKDLKGGDVKFTIENSDGERFSTPVTKTLVLASR